MLLQDSFSLLAYTDPHSSPVGYLLDPIQREPVCAALNSAILGVFHLTLTCGCPPPPLSLSLTHSLSLSLLGVLYPSPLLSPLSLPHDAFPPCPLCRIKEPSRPASTGVCSGPGRAVFETHVPEWTGVGCIHRSSRHCVILTHPHTLLTQQISVIIPPSHYYCTIKADIDFYNKHKSVLAKPQHASTTRVM